ncbi:MAG: TonB-dependent receptor plug domain-containing protein, partial [Bacteroidales bacterium]
GIGRLSIKVSFLGYDDIILSDLLIASGKEVDLNIEMRERVINKQEVIVSAGRERHSGLNQMASISTQTIRIDDALRFAGGFYDPSRIVNAFAGVVTSNDDESNDIIIRGNSSRGLLWRLEGIEIPNPNHFSDGHGGSGGAYSAITSNVISNFDFLTGAFPAEYGNAISGVMDLNLRKGNSDHYEYALQTGMIGMEGSAEGPLNNNNGSSFLIDARYVNFGYLSRLNLIDLGSTNYAPRSKDLVFNVNLPSKKSGSVNVFGFCGSSEFGKVALHNTALWSTDDDRWEEMQGQSSSVFGIKHLLSLHGGRGFVRSVVAFTSFTDTYSEGYVDSSFIRTNSYHHSFRYPALRFSFLLNNKLSSKNTLRTGINIQFLDAEMEKIRLNSTGRYDKLVAPSAFGVLFQYYYQLQNRITENFEINSGVHIMLFTVNGDLNLEPRLGFRWSFAPGKFFNAGLGLHSRAEAFPVYYNLIKNSSGVLETLNKNLDFSKSFQLVSGVDLAITSNIRLRAEVYNQQLFDIPIIYKSNSTYSAINAAEELPSSYLSNNGLGYNRGFELTLEKSFSNNYYFLFTVSLFNSKYKPGDGNWYNTYYNTSFVSNFLAGKDFYLGRNKRNSIGINTKSLFRGGYRYTPVDMVASLKSKKIIYATSKTYASQLPDFFRIDAGINFRRNNPGFSWIIMLDVQNVTDNKNIFRKRFSYQNGGVVTTYDYSIGAVPVFNLRFEF